MKESYVENKNKLNQKIRLKKLEQADLLDGDEQKEEEYEYL